MSVAAGPAWSKLRAHHHSIQDVRLNDLFAGDAARGSALSAGHEGIYLDYSKQRVTRHTLDLLIELAHQSELSRGIESLFVGDRINVSENRSVLHTALRSSRDQSITLDGEDVVPAVHAVLDRMSDFATRVRTGRWRGATGKRIRTVINIGIGGSHLGPEMTSRALIDCAHPGLDVRFVSNVDGADLVAALRDADPAETLFVVASKTFTTIETLTNAKSARTWLLDALGDPSAVRSHFVAVSTNAAQVSAFGIAAENMFEFWDWVGGRYSVHAAIGLSLMIEIGPTAFTEMLAGARSIDDHFRSAPFHRNIPVLLALLGVWNRNFLGASTHAVLPYDHRLARFPAYLQQLEMESNGKSVDLHGNPVSVATAPIVWGEPGTNGQHSFFQLLHQGTDIVPCDFIGTLTPAHTLDGHHDLLMANLLAQTQALAFGSNSKFTGDDAASEPVPARTFAGNRSSSTILIDALTPYTVGQLIAIYEHKVFTQGWIWGINSFDQWGVELGKVLANRILTGIESDTGPPDGYDSSTATLLSLYRRHRGTGLTHGS